ncbi:MAG: hypothetical protein QM765_31970 [Myxococcales bacterium]
MKNLVGRWRVEDGTFRGLEYEFRGDGSFEMSMDEFDVRAAGRYRIRAEGQPFEIDIHFVQHSSPEGLGIVRGIFELQGDKLRMKVGGVQSERWMDPGQFVVYARAA